MQVTLEEVKTQIEELARIINVHPRMFPSFGSMTWESWPFIEQDEKGYLYYVVSEKGYRKEILAMDLDHLLYLVFEGITVDIAVQYELNNRIEEQDSRRISFAKQEELLGMLNPKWQQKKADEHKAILQVAPFNDLKG